jgi:hypothetical protein
MSAFDSKRTGTGPGLLSRKMTFGTYFTGRKSLL